MGRDRNPALLLTYCVTLKVPIHLWPQLPDQPGLKDEDKRKKVKVDMTPINDTITIVKMKA